MTTERRGFLKLLTSFVGGVAVAKYAEPFIDSKINNKKWIDDRGDYCIINVPDYKVFANEFIDKPAIFILGQLATVRDIHVKGFANFYIPKGGVVCNSSFDGSKMITANNRPIINAKGQSISFAGIHITTPESKKDWRAFGINE